jgi:hypothetical protein
MQPEYAVIFENNSRLVICNENGDIVVFSLDIPDEPLIIKA